MPEFDLVINQNYRGKVVGIEECGGGFKGKDGAWRECHHISIETETFPGYFFKTQICSKIKRVNEFEVNDLILFKVTGYSGVGEDRYTIKFESKLFKKDPVKETFGAPAAESDLTSNKPDVHVYSEKRIEQAIAGTKWSICLTAAYSFHKDRKGATDKDVISTLKSYMRSFNEYQKDEEKYLAND